MRETLKDARVPDSVIQRELARLVGYGVVSAYAGGPRYNGRRTYTVTLPGGQAFRWEVGATYAFILGAFGMAEALERREP